MLSPELRPGLARLAFAAAAALPSLVLADEGRPLDVAGPAARIVVPVARPVSARLILPASQERMPAGRAPLTHGTESLIMPSGPTELILVAPGFDAPAGRSPRPEPPTRRAYPYGWFGVPHRPKLEQHHSGDSLRMRWIWK